MKNIKISKKTVFISVIVLLVLFLVGLLIFSPNTVDESCDWCGNSPSIEYELKSGKKSYVCKDCSKVCVWCGEKADRHYENISETMVFVCNDCYEGIN